MGWGCGWRNIMMIASNLVRREVRRALHHVLGLDGGARLAGRGAARQPSVQRCRRRAASAPQHAPWAAPACALRPASAARAERLHLSAAGESGAGVPGAFGAAERARSPPADQAGRAPRQGMREKLFGGAGFVPDIPWLQAWLECAWRSSVDTDGSNQLGGAVQSSHAWIGTTEAAALLRQFGLRARIVDFVGAPPRPPPRPCHLPFLGGTSPERCVPSPAVRALLQRVAASRLEFRPRHAQRSQLQHVGACAAGAPRNARAPPRAGTDDSRDLKRQKSRPADARCQRGGFEQSFPQEYARGNGAAGGAEAGAQGGPVQGGPAQVHSTVECDGCGVSPIRGTRFQSKARPAPACAHAWSARTWSCTLRRDGVPGTRQRCSGAQLRGASGGCHRAMQARRMGHQQAAAFVHRLKRLPRSLLCAGC